MDNSKYFLLRRGNPPYFPIILGFGCKGLQPIRKFGIRHPKSRPNPREAFFKIASAPKMELMPDYARVDTIAVHWAV